MNRDPDGFPFDPDPLHVDDDVDHRVPRWDPRAPGEPGMSDGVPGPAIVLTIVGIPLLVLIILAIAWSLANPSPAAGGHTVSQPAQSEPASLPATTVRGVATWYDAPSSGEAAAGPGLRKALGSHWRGSSVRVCADGCVTVRLTDWCACGPRNGRPTVIDLDDHAFRRLAPLSAGVVRVTVTAAAASERRAPTAPPTDVE